MNTVKLTVHAVGLILAIACMLAHAEQARFCKRNDGVQPPPLAPGLRALPSINYADYCDKPGFTCKSVPATGPNASKYDCFIISTKGKLPEAQPEPAQPQSNEPPPNMPLLVARNRQAQVPGGAGKISICRTPGINELMDNKSVEISATSTYAGSCDKNGDNCRSLIVAASEGATLAPGKKSCVVIPASIQSSDGKPLRAGSELRPQWVIKGFTPTVKVVSDFK